MRKNEVDETGLSSADIVLGQTPQSTEEILAFLGELPPSLDVTRRAIAVIRNPASCLSDLADILSLDPVLSALVLRWANSAYFGLLKPITALRQAIVLLGFRAVENLIHAASIALFMDGKPKVDPIDRSDLRRHSVAVAYGAKLVAQTWSREIAEEAYSAGLLCDLGMLAIEAFQKHGWISIIDRETVQEGELDSPPMDHAHLGAEIARRWNLPSPIIEAIAHHHHPRRAHENPVLTSAVHIADCATMVLGISRAHMDLSASLDPFSLQKLDWDERNYQWLQEQIRSYLVQVELYLSVPSEGSSS
jgi:HD-like signal output (HDOD) protein